MAGISGSDDGKRRAAEIRGRKEKSQQRAGGKKRGDGVKRHRSAASNERRSDGGGRRRRGGSCNLHTLIKLLSGSLVLHVSAPSAPPARPHPHSLSFRDYL